MEWTFRKTSRKDGSVDYAVEFIEHQLEDVINRLNRFKREDEKPFDAVEELSDFNQRAYELFAQPMVKAVQTNPPPRWDAISILCDFSAGPSRILIPGFMAGACR